jgi:hypothetical protein
VLVEADTVHLGALQIRGAGVWVAIEAKRLGAELIAEDPEDVRPVRNGRIGDVMAGRLAWVLNA